MNNDEVKPNLVVGGTKTTIQYWDKRETKARMLLKLSVKDCIIPHIRDYKTVPEIWKMLKDLCEVKNTNRLLFLKRNILSIKMEENESISSFISWIKEVKYKLNDIDHTVANDDMVIITMNGTRDDYQMLIRD